jgi:hypothetical protein
MLLNWKEASKMTDEAEKVESDEDKKNDEWLKTTFFDLMQTYPREWIAVQGQRVIAKASTMNEVKKMAEELVSDKEFSVYFIPPTGVFSDVGFASK